MRKDLSDGLSVYRISGCGRPVPFPDISTGEDGQQILGHLVSLE